MRVNPSPSIWIASLAGFALFTALGCWQLRRGHEKAALNAAQAAQLQQAPLLLNAHSQVPPDIVGRHASAVGRYLASRQMLLDNQSNGDRAGFDALTPLQLGDGSIVVVNRGWIPREAKASLPRLPLMSVRVIGMWRRLPQPAVHLAGANNCSDGDWPRVVEYPSPADLVCLFGAQVLAGELLLDPDQPNGFVRDWRLQPEFPPERHYGYAATWFAFCIVIIVLLLRRIWKR